MILCELVFCDPPDNLECAFSHYPHQVCKTNIFTMCAKSRTFFSSLFGFSIQSEETFEHSLDVSFYSHDMNLVCCNFKSTFRWTDTVRQTKAIDRSEEIRFRRSRIL